MLTRIRLKNIQKHKDLTLNLDKINVIIGATDTGKTSVFRGLLWGLTNNESGENLINNGGAKSCSVLLNIDGHEVERSWTKSKNAYRLDDKEFTTFRTTVPSPITDLLKMTELNVQGRRDLPFMVYYKASECANQFSEMLDLDEIDGTISNVNKAVKQKSEHCDNLKQQIKQYEDELKKYDKVDEAVQALSKLASIRGELLKVEERHTRLEALYNNACDAHKDFEKVPNPWGALEDLKRICDVITRYNTIGFKLDELNNYKTAYEMISSTLSKYKNFDKASNEFVKVTDIAKKGKDLKMRQEVLEELRQQLCRSESLVKSTRDTYQDLHDNFVEIFPEVCPLCGGTHHAL